MTGDAIPSDRPDGERVSCECVGHEVHIKLKFARPRPLRPNV